MDLAASLCHVAPRAARGRVTVADLSDDLTQDDNWLAGVWATLRARKWLVLAVTLASLLAAIVYLRTATYVYTAELRVYAAPSTTGGSQVPGGLGSLASLAGLGGSSVEVATPFRLYVEGVHSREVAERMARDRAVMRTIFAREWDPATNSFRERRGLGGSIKRAVWGVLGLPVDQWHAPDAARLEGFIADNVDVVQSVKTPLVTISLDTPDPQFGVRFLTTLGATVDAYLREKQQARTRGNIAYLSDKLRGVTLAEQRQVLFAALGEQERQAMLANTDAPYAAIPFGVATASSNPTKPRQMPLLIAGLVGGLIAGCALAILLGPPRRRSVAVLESA